MKLEREHLMIDPEVDAALQAGKPVVALESTIIAHGMPYPQNVETAERVGDMVRSNGAIPATIGILHGKIKVGMNAEEIRYLAQAEKVWKVSRRDFPAVIAEGADGATTVAATMIAAKMAGIKVFVTGGIGGVHRGAGESFDISADLEELKETDVVVVCAGVKSILDIGATLEYLETSGVPVITFGTNEFPAFYSRGSGFTSECRVDDALRIAEMIRIKYELGLRGGMLIACPIPGEYEIGRELIEKSIKKALKRSQLERITGKRITPFLLDQIKDITEGRSLEANIQLILNNAAIGAQIACQLKQT